MSEDTNTPAVVEKTDAQPQAGAEAATGARTNDSLDAALNEFDAATRPSSTPEPKPAAAATTAPDDVKRRVEQLERTLAERDFRSTITPILAKVRGDVPADVFDDDEMIGWLDTKAKKDQRLRQAWIDRDKNPAAWDRVVEGLGREFGQKFAKPIDERATADRHAVTAAVRGSSNKAPEGKAPDLAGMTAAELREYSKKEYGFTPPV